MNSGEIKNNNRALNIVMREYAKMTYRDLKFIVYYYLVLKKFYLMVICEDFGLFSVPSRESN